MIVDIFNTDKKYSIIYADPPWKYKFSVSKQRAVTNHYSVMAPDEMNELPVPGITSENAVLIMWATFPKLKEALELCEKWGFRYVTTAFVWIKQNKKARSLFWGMGYYTRSNAEICLLAVKGKPPARVSHHVHQVVFEPVAEHSKKPDAVRDKIVELFGDLPRIELFARDVYEGRDSWGDEL